MIPVIGIVVVLGCIAGGYLMEKGNLLVLMQPAELLIIGGAALGTVLIGNPIYVLKAIGELSQNEEDTLSAIAPRLQRLYGGGGQWHEAIERAVRMEADTSEQIRGMWASNLEIARANGLKLTPQ